MKEEDLQSLAAAWVASEAKPEALRDENDWQSIFAVQDLDGLPEALWAFVLHALKLAEGQDVLGILAAGPLEDLIQGHGQIFIDEIESLAEVQPVFASLLPNVWILPAPDEITRRYEALGCQFVSMQPR